MSEKILITGCSGFLAGYLMDTLGEDGPVDIVGITEEAGFRSSKCRVHRVDVTDRHRLMDLVAETSPDLVFHLAAISNVGFSWRNQELTYNVNVIGSSNLMEALWQHQPGCRVVLMSSGEVYDFSLERIHSENSAARPRNPYALSKAAMEMIGELYARTRKMDVVILRSFNFTGPGQARRFVCSDFAAQVAALESSQEEKLIRVGNLDVTRDFSDVRDMARYVAAAARRGRGGEIYNIASGKSHSLHTVLDILLSLARADIRVVVDKDRFRPVDAPVMEADCSRMREELDLQPRFTLKDTLQDTLEYWRRRLS